MSKTIRAYYNEFDPKAALWLRQLIKNGNITPGEVDERSITEVKQSDLQGFDRVHFFSGIGTWDYCINQAGWGDRPVWTASLPCQPFSTAGKGLGKDDERHLLPHFLELVRQCKPDTIFGEQVERAIAHGWLDDLQAAMEAENYAIGHCVLGAHSIGAPHIRQRLYWVADSKTAARKRTKQGNHSKSYGGELINGMGVSDSAEDHSRGSKPPREHDTGIPLSQQVAMISNGYTAETTNTGQLNPALSRWLMGLPEEWCIAAIQAHRSMPTQRKKLE